MPGAVLWDVVVNKMSKVVASCSKENSEKIQCLRAFVHEAGLGWPA